MGHNSIKTNKAIKGLNNLSYFYIEDSVYKV